MGMLALAAAAPTGAARAAGTEPWITTWAATPAPRWAEELPAPFNVPETLEGQTVRQIARIGVGGDQVRIVLSNEFGTRPVTIGNTTVALSAGGDKVDPETIKPVTFGGQTSAVIPPGAPLISDPVDLAVKPLSSVAVSFYLPKKTGVTSVHWDGAQTTYISAAGDKTKDADFKPDSTDKSRLFLSRILTTAKPDFERDRVLRRFHHRRRLLDRRHQQPLARSHRRAAESRRPSGCRGRQRGLFRRSCADEWNGHQRAEPLRHIGPRPSARLDGGDDDGHQRHRLAGQGLQTPSDPEPTAEDIIAGYKQIIQRAHDHGLRFVGVTLTPFVDTFKGLPTYGYYTPEKEQIREAVNDWIRANKTADGLIDFDKLLEDPNNPKHINPAYNCGDNLHPNDAGYQAMAKSVDLNVLVPKD